VQFSKKYNCWKFSKPKYGSVRTIEVDKDTMELLRRTRIQQIKDAGNYAEFYIRHTLDANNCLDTSKDGASVALVNVEECGQYIQPRRMQYVSRVIHGKENEPAISESFDFHSLRHTHTTMLLEAGLDIKYVSERLGHKNIQTTLDIYAHLTDKIRETNKSKLESIYKSS
jgi:integrase